MDLFKSRKQAKISQRWSSKKINITRTKAHITNLEKSSESLLNTALEQ